MDHKGLSGADVIRPGPLSAVCAQVLSLDTRRLGSQPVSKREARSLPRPATTLESADSRELSVRKDLARHKRLGRSSLTALQPWARIFEKLRCCGSRLLPHSSDCCLWPAAVSSVLGRRLARLFDALQSSRAFELGVCEASASDRASDCPI